MTVGYRLMRSASIPALHTIHRRASTGFLHGCGSCGGRGRCPHARPCLIALMDWRDTPKAAATS